MADTSLNFGPAWLHSLSSGSSMSNSTSAAGSGPTKFKLSEHRYGKEEMLTLCLENSPIPNNFEDCQEVLNSVCLQPLSLQPITEEEQFWHISSVNSSSSGGGGGGFHSRGGSHYPSGRGMSRNDGMDRGGYGRGRGRDREYYNRNDEEEKFPSRGRAYRGGFEEENVANSSRGGFGAPPGGLSMAGGRGGGTGMPGRSNMSENWRNRGSTNNRDRAAWRHGEDERGDWRGEKGYDKHRHSSQEHDHRGKSRVYSNSNYESGREQMPEWMENEKPSCKTDDGVDIGTFDSTGVFVSEKVDRKSPLKSKSEEIVVKRENMMHEDGSSNNEKRNYVNVLADNTDTGHKSNTQENERSFSKRVESKHVREKEESVNDKDVIHVKQKEETSTIKKNHNNNSSSIGSQLKSLVKKGKVFEVSKSKSTSASSDTSSKHSNNSGGKNKVDDSCLAGYIEMEAQKLASLLSDEEGDIEEKENVSKSEGGKRLDMRGYLMWYYRDQQGQIQGAFPQEQMAEWHAAGYFMPHLEVKRECDKIFIPLVDMISRYGCIPFTTDPHQVSPPPPLTEAAVPPQPKPLTTLPPPQTNSASVLAQIQHQQQQEQQLQLLQHLLLQQNEPQQHHAAGTVNNPHSWDAMQHMLQVLQNQNVGYQLPVDQTSNSINGARDRSHPKGQQAALPVQGTLWGGDTTVHPGQVEPQQWNQILNMPSGSVDARALEQTLKAEIEKMKQQEEKQRLAEQEELRKKEELRQKEIEEQQRQVKEAEMRLKAEVERKRQVEFERQKQLEFERQKQLEREEMERRTEMERQKEVEMQRLQLEMEKQRKIEAEKLRQRQIELEKEAERQRQAELEMQRQMEERRRIEREAEEAKLNELPPTAHWANTGSGEGVSLADIQQQEQQKMTEKDEQTRQFYIEHQQMILDNIRKQQERNTNLQTAPWASHPQVSSNNVSSSGTSLREIQEEEARQLEDERNKRKKEQQQRVAGLQMGQVGAWGHNHSEQMSWGKGAAKLPGQNAVPNKSSKPKSTAGFPQPANTNSKGKGPTNKTKKEQDKIRMIFENSCKPNDEFTKWCMQALNKFDASVDAQTFISFLKDVESPFEVQSYVGAYLGENREAQEFSKEFLERRSKAKQRQRNVPDDDMLGPAHANPATGLEKGESAIIGQNAATNADKKKKKQKRQVVDTSILGFSVHAASDRVNVGEIEKVNS